MKAALHMGALAAARSKPPIRALYERLLVKGKPKRVTLVACMRELLVTCDAVVHDGQSWSASHDLIA